MASASTTSRPGGAGSLTALATVAAAFVVSQQTAGKATRDALFLLAHDVGDLPRMMVMAAVASLVAIPLLTRYMVVLGPRATVPGLFTLSALGFAFEWWLSGLAPKTAASLLFLHQSVLGPILISGFWSLASERFDVRTMKAVAPRIATGATAGGLAGGVLAERLSLLVEPVTMLPILGAIHLVCVFLVLPLRTQRQSRVVDDQPGTAEVLRNNPYLLHIGLLLLTVTVATGLLDFVFKAAATERFEGADLLRFFAVFYTASSAVTLVVQAAVARWWPKSVGPAGNVAFLPASLGAGALLVLTVPGLAARTAAVALTRVIQSSIFRTGYEMLYAPVPVADRRAAKTANDVWFDRLGDLAAGLLIQGVRSVGAIAVLPVLMGATVAVAASSFALVFRLRREYVASLENKVVDAAFEAGAEVHDGMSHEGLYTAFAAEPEEQPGRAEPPPDASDEADPVVERIDKLRRAPPLQLRALLAEGQLSAAEAPHAIRLLARHDLHTDAVEALRRAGPRVSGALIDALLDPGRPRRVRRRIPRVLADDPRPHVVSALSMALADTSFEVRFASAHALAQIHEHDPDLRVRTRTVYSAILRACESDTGPNDAARLEYLFVLLSLFLPGDAVHSAYVSLTSGEPGGRATALEYLDNVLPSPIKTQLMTSLEAL